MPAFRFGAIDATGKAQKEAHDVDRPRSKGGDYQDSTGGSRALCL